MTPENETLYATLLAEARAGMADLQARPRPMLDGDLPKARWCGYCQRGIPECVCPPWMPNTGTEEERKARGDRQEAERIRHMAQTTAERQQAFKQAMKDAGMVRLEAWVTKEQRDKFRQLGGDEWLRKKIDAAKEKK